MSRYNNTEKDKKNKKNYYQTTIYRKVDEKNSDSYFIATEGDRCDNLAQRFYGDSTLWWFIAHVNNIKTMNIEAGVRLRISFDLEKAKGIIDKSA